MQRRSRSQNEVEPTMGIGPMTSSLPKKCSTTELRGRSHKEKGRHVAPRLARVPSSARLSLPAPRQYSVGEATPQRGARPWQGERI